MKKLVASDISLVTSWKEKVKPIFQAYEKSRPQGGPKSRPSEAVMIWKGGARGRAEDVFFAIGVKRRGRKADFATTWKGRLKSIFYALGKKPPAGRPPTASPAKAGRGWKRGVAE